MTSTVHCAEDQYSTSLGRKVLLHVYNEPSFQTFLKFTKSFYFSFFHNLFLKIDSLSTSFQVLHCSIKRMERLSISSAKEPYRKNHDKHNTAKSISAKELLLNISTSNKFEDMILTFDSRFNLLK